MESTGSDRESELLQQLESLGVEMVVKAETLSQTIKRHQNARTPPAEVREAARAADAVDTKYSARLQELQELTGLSDEVLDEYERRGRPKGNDRITRHDIETAPPTGDLPALAAAGLEELLSIVSPEWLRTQSANPFRLGHHFLSKPLHLVSGVRIDSSADLAAPHRFARMLLACQDFLEGNKEFDFIAGPMLVGEIAVLGNNIREIRSLGREGNRKLESLQTVDTTEVPSVIHELLVGAAFVRRGIDTEMVSARPGSKSPDLRLPGHLVPTAIECKRRLGLTRYEMREAAHVEALYASIRPLLASTGRCCSIEVTFLVEPFAITEQTFSSAVVSLFDQKEAIPWSTNWGVLRQVSLPAVIDVPAGRLYSPNYLAKVFGWSSLEALWDGLLCDVESPEGIYVDRARLPRCLKWSSVSATAITKKSRGITSLWASAAKQIPAGEMGLLYIAYAEGARPYLADARTQYIMETAERWWHRWTVNLPMTVVSRLYARPLGPGEPDFIENSVRLASPWAEETANEFPAGIFVPE